MSHRVVVLALPGVVTFDLACAIQIFGIRPSRPEGRPLYDFAVCGTGGRRVATSDGLTLPLQHSLRALGEADTVLVPGYRRASQAAPSAASLRALTAAAANGARVVSFCVGAFALGHAGLLDGRRATTHWDAAAALEAQFPQCDVDPTPLYLDEGDVLTSAGMAAALDLGLHVVRRDHGVQAAADIARWNVVSPHREGGQAQFIRRPLPADASPGLAATRSWALEHLAAPLTLADLAKHACCSQRTLTRHFGAETGLSPKQWLIEMRTARARELLESSDLPVEQVADQAGFPTANALRARFAAALGTSPTSYRRRFKPNGPLDGRLPS